MKGKCCRAADDDAGQSCRACPSLLKLASPERRMEAPKNLKRQRDGGTIRATLFENFISTTIKPLQFFTRL